MGKMMALSLGLVGGFALGVWTGPHITPRPDSSVSTAHELVVAPAVPAPDVAGGSQARHVAIRSARATAQVAVSATALHDRLKPVLNRGADMTVAAKGFRSAEEFAAVAHAARNTDVPFLLLKHRVLEEGKSLASAIRASKPSIDAGVAASLARAQARSDIASIAG